MNSKLNSVLEQIRASLTEDTARGKPGPVKPIDMKIGDRHTFAIKDLFFDLMDEVSCSLGAFHGMTAAKAFNFAAEVGDHLEQKGMMPPFPSDDMNDADVAKWVNMASYTNFKDKVLKHAMRLVMSGEMK